MRHSISPRRRSTVSSEKVTIPCFKLDLKSIANRLPLKGGVKAATGSCLKNLAASEAEEKGLVGSREVLAIAALEANKRLIIIINKFYLPSCLPCGAVTVLANALVVVFGEEELVVMAAEADGLGALEEVHGEEKEGLLAFGKVGLEYKLGIWRGGAREGALGRKRKGGSGEGRRES